RGVNAQLVGCRTSVDARAYIRRARAPALHGLRSTAADRSVRSTHVLALFEWEPVLGVGWADVVGAGADQAVVVELFDYVGGPSADSRYGEHGGEEVYVDSERVVSRSGIEVDVGVEFL